MVFAFIGMNTTCKNRESARAWSKAADCIRIDLLDVGKAIKECTTAPEEYLMEDAYHAALIEAFDSLERWPRSIAAYLCTCLDAVQAAKDTAVTKA